MDVLDSQGLNLATLEPYDAKPSHSLVGSLAPKSFHSLAAFDLAAGPEVISIQAVLTGETAIRTDRIAASTATTTSLNSGDSITGFVNSRGDHDWLRVQLTAGSRYLFKLNRLSGPLDPLLSLRNSSGVLLTSNDDANGSLNSQINFTATSTGTYYLDAGAYADSGTGQYQLLMSQLVIDQYAANTSTTGVITDGGSVSSTIDSNGDHDWFRIALTAGRSYTFNLNQVVGSQGLADPLLALRDSSGVLLTSNDDANGSLNSQINFTATSTGTYYLDAGAYADSGTGQYQLLAAEAAAPTPGYSTVTGYGEASVKRALEAMLNTTLPSVADLGGIFWGLDRLGAPEAWSAGYTGSGITVAVVDTGVDYTHSDLDGNIWINSGEIAGNGIDDDGNGYIDDVRGWNFDANTNNVMDDNSHGTHVAGTIAGENNGVGITGVAYNARIMAVKVLSASGSGTLTAVANGIRYAADNGAKVINLSLGGGGSADLLAAVSYATSRGAVVVMAAGNEAAASPSYPAAYAQSYGLAVGAIDSAGNLASFSNRAGSTQLDYITAAGVSVYSSVPGGGYASYSGTSMATPHIAGAMALLQQANIQNNKGLSVAALETLITSSASNMVTASGLMDSSRTASTSALASGMNGSSPQNSENQNRLRRKLESRVEEAKEFIGALPLLERGPWETFTPRPISNPVLNRLRNSEPGSRSPEFGGATNRLIGPTAINGSNGMASVIEAVVTSMNNLTRSQRSVEGSFDPLTGLKTTIQSTNITRTGQRR